MPGRCRVGAPGQTRRQWVTAMRRRRTSSCVGLHPTGTWAQQAVQNGSSNLIGIRRSTMALVEVRCGPTAGRPRVSSHRKVVRSEPVKVVLGTLRSLVTVVQQFPSSSGLDSYPT